MKNKSLIIIILFIYIGCSTKAQAPAFQWAKSVGGSGFDDGYGVSSDASGNVYVTGAFLSPSITFGTFTLTNAGGYDIFITKYDVLGNVLWAKNAGGNGDDFAYSISINAGNVFITGSFRSSTLVFGTTTLTNTAGGWDNVFIAKYDASGNVLWAKRAIGTGVGNSVSTDSNGNVFVSGWFSNPGITFGTFTLPNTGDYNIFITKYDASGNVIWAKSAGDITTNATSVVADVTGNLFVTGGFTTPTITFGTFTLTNAAAFQMDIFIAKYDATGNVLWAKSAGGTFSDYGGCISTDAFGNAFVTGVFSSPSVVFGTYTLTNGSGFLVKYDTNGNILWANSSAGGYGKSVTIDAINNIFLTGTFGPTLSLGTTTLTSVGFFDIFIAKYDATGNLLWTKSVGGTGNDYGQTISTFGTGNAFIAGFFRSPTIAFGTTTLTNVNTNNSTDFYVASLTDFTGIENYTDEKGFNIFPNPNNGLFTLQIDASPGAAPIVNGEIILINSLGQKIHEQKVIQGINNITTNGLSTGLYNYILLEDKQKINSGKLVVE